MRQLHKNQLRQKTKGARQKENQEEDKGQKYKDKSGRKEK
jgi:hypothetical protein